MVYCFDLFWGLQGLVLPLNHSTILLTSSREDLSDSRVLNHPNHPKKSWAKREGRTSCSVELIWKLANFEAVKSDSVNLWPIQPWLLLHLGFLPYPPNSDHFLRVTGGWFADGVGGAAAGVNGFLTSENSETSTWIGAKRAKRYIKCIRLQLLPRGWLLHRANNKSPEASPGQGEDSKASWVNHGKSNNQPAVGDGLLPLISGKIGDGSLFWGYRVWFYHLIILPFSLPVAVRTCQIQESWTIQTIQKKVEPNVRDVLLAVSSQLEKFTNFEAVKSDSVNLWPIQPWLLLQLGFPSTSQIIPVRIYKSCTLQLNSPGVYDSGWDGRTPKLQLKNGENHDEP